MACAGVAAVAARIAGGSGHGCPAVVVARGGAVGGADRTAPGAALPSSRICMAVWNGRARRLARGGSRRAPRGREPAGGDWRRGGGGRGAVGSTRCRPERSPCWPGAHKWLVGRAVVDAGRCRLGRPVAGVVAAGTGGRTASAYRAGTAVRARHDDPVRRGRPERAGGVAAGDVERAGRAAARGRRGRAGADAGGRAPVHGIARDGGSLRQSAGARLDCRPGPGGRPGHRPGAHVAGAGRPVSSCPPAAGRAIGAAGAGQDAAAPGRLHLSLHVHRAGVPHCRPAAAGGEGERPPGPAARAAQAIAGQGLDGAAAGVAGPTAARATIGDLAGAMPGGAYLRHAIRHRRGVRVARWLRAEGVQGVAAPPDRVMPRRCGRCRSSGWRC